MKDRKENSVVEMEREMLILSVPRLHDAVMIAFLIETHNWYIEYRIQ